MTVSFTLRNASVTDSSFFYEVKKLVLKKYIEEIWGWEEDFQLKFHEENFNPTNTFIIEINETPAGTVEVREEPDRIFLCSLYILPAYQNKKIGTRICKMYMEKAQQQGKRICLEVLKINHRAQRLYSRLGFSLIEGDDTKYFMFKDYLS